MNYLKVPNSSLKLKSGDIVMLSRFPGTKWTVQEGWYTYNSRQYFGWYFSSIPAKTILPVNPQDLVGIALVSNDGGSSVPPMPVTPSGPPIPEPEPKPDPWYPGPPDGPKPGPYPGPNPWDRFGPNPYPPHRPIDPKRLDYFTTDDRKVLDSTVIVLSNLTDLDRLDTSDLHDGRIVIVNSARGVRRTYIWNKRDDTWDEFDLYQTINHEIDVALEEYTTTEGMNSAILTAKAEIAEDINTVQNTLQGNIDTLEYQVSDAISGLDQRITTNTTDIEALDSRINEVQTNTNQAIANLTAKENADVSDILDKLAVINLEISELSETVAANAAKENADVGGITGRLDILEDAVFNIKRLTELLGDNTILVANHGTISDSGISIGDEEIGEIAEYANTRTVATEKAVAELVERSQTRWSSF